MHDDEVLHSAVSSTLARLKSQHQELKQSLEQAYGYAVFPSIGRAGVVVGGAHGKGEVFEQGEHVGNATLSQLTVGVQVGGETFSELLLFGAKESLTDFKRSPVKFTSNASAVMVKAGGTGTTDFKGVTALAFKEGGELLEASLGVKSSPTRARPAKRPRAPCPLQRTKRRRNREVRWGSAARFASKLERQSHSISHGSPGSCVPRPWAAARRRRFAEIHWARACSTRARSRPG